MYVFAAMYSQCQYVLAVMYWQCIWMMYPQRHYVFYEFDIIYCSDSGQCVFCVIICELNYVANLCAVVRSTELEFLFVLKSFFYRFVIVIGFVRTVTVYIAFCSLHFMYHSANNRII